MSSMVKFQDVIKYKTGIMLFTVFTGECPKQLQNYIQDK